MREIETTKMTIRQILNIPIGELAKSTISRLYQLHEEAKIDLEKARITKEWIEAAIALKYDEKIRAKRLRLEKDNGVIHLEDNGFKVTSDIPKKVEWNQELLVKVAGDIALKGGSLSNYVEIHYNVPERLYNSWPESIRSMFLPARSVRLGRPFYKLTKLDDGGNK